MTPVAKSLLPSQRVLNRKLSQRCGTKTKPCQPNKLVNPWLIVHLRCTVPDAKRTFNKPRLGLSLSLSQLFAAELAPVAGIIHTQSVRVEMFRWYPAAAVMVAALGFLFRQLDRTSILS